MSIAVLAAIAGLIVVGLVIWGIVAIVGATNKRD